VAIRNKSKAARRGDYRKKRLHGKDIGTHLRKRKINGSAKTDSKDRATFTPLCRPEK